MKTSSEFWLQIPVAPKYEISNHGRVRNIRTGKILKTKITRCRCKVVGLFTDDKPYQIPFSINQLMWLTHGKIPKKTSIALPIIISKGNERHYFDSLRATARFLAPREHYSEVRIRRLLCRRLKEICGWRINYQR